MKYIRRLTSVGLLAMAGFAGTSYAQTVVIDPAVISQIVLQLKQMIAEYQVLQSSLAAVQHGSPNIMGIAPGLMSGQMRLPGSSASMMPGLNFGSGLTSGGSSFYGQNHVYTPTGTDWQAQELQRRQVATANIQGESQTGMTQIAARIASLAQLEASIQSQPDVTAVAAVNARINAEHAYLANESNNVSNLRLLQQSQATVDQQRAEQHDRQQAEQWGSASSVQAGW
jgi:type IV secretion system protein VirB5